VCYRFKNDDEYLMLSHECITNFKLAAENVSQPAKLFSHAHEDIMMTKPAGIIINSNEFFTHVTGIVRSKFAVFSPMDWPFKCPVIVECP
jgi:ribulose 1,5-bisphosphate synthetase/thiazole synthase